jgi:hypothetical protein
MRREWDGMGWDGMGWDGRGNCDPTGSYTRMG